MNCNRWTTLIMRYFSGDLSTEELKAFEKHRDSCVQCKQRWEWEKTLQTGLETLEPVEAPDGFNQAVWQKIENQGDGFHLKRGFKWLPLMVGASALAVIVLAVIGFQGTPSPEQPVIQIASNPETDQQSKTTALENKPETVRIQSERTSKKGSREDVVAHGGEFQSKDVKEASNAVEKHIQLSTKKIESEPMQKSNQHQETPMLTQRKDRQISRKSGYKKTRVNPAVEIERRSAAVGGDASQTQVSQILSTQIRHIQIYNNKIHIQRQEKVRLEFELPSAGRVTASVFSKEGRLVKAILNKQLLQGASQLEWDGKNQHGNDVASGIYMLVLSGDVETQKFKIVVVK